MSPAASAAGMQNSIFEITAQGDPTEEQPGELTVFHEAAEDQTCQDDLIAFCGRLLHTDESDIKLIDDVDQSFGGGRQRRRPLWTGRILIAQESRVHGGVERLLVGEVLEQQRLGDTCRFRQGAGRRSPKPALGEDLSGCRENRLTALFGRQSS